MRQWSQTGPLIGYFIISDSVVPSDSKQLSWKAPRVGLHTSADNKVKAPTKRRRTSLRNCGSRVHIFLYSVLLTNTSRPILHSLGERKRITGIWGKAPSKAVFILLALTLVLAFQCYTKKWKQSYNGDIIFLHSRLAINSYAYMVVENWNVLKSHNHARKYARTSHRPK